MFGVKIQFFECKECLKIQVFVNKYGLHKPKDKGRDEKEARSVRYVRTILPFGVQMETEKPSDEPKPVENDENVDGVVEKHIDEPDAMDTVEATVELQEAQGFIVEVDVENIKEDELVTYTIPTMPRAGRERLY